MSFSPAPGDRLTAVLRPEALLLKNDPDLMQATVKQAMYLGTSSEYIVDVDGQELIVVESDPSAEQIFRDGQSVGISFVPETVHLLAH